MHANKYSHTLTPLPYWQMGFGRKMSISLYQIEIFEALEYGVFLCI